MGRLPKEQGNLRIEVENFVLEPNKIKVMFDLERKSFENLPNNGRSQVSGRKYGATYLKI
jgi:hypothetical protein